MPRVWISIGTNIERRKHVIAALDALTERFGRLRMSPVYETPAVGFEGDPFYNLVVGFDTTLRPGALHTSLRDIESANGRTRSARKFSARTLDLDLLTYGAEITEEGGKRLPRDEIEQYPFVLKPLADVAPDDIYPPTGQTYAQMWQQRPADWDEMVQDPVLSVEIAGH